MAVPARISIVTLGVADVARSTTFYEALGWQRSSASQESITFINTSGPVLALFGRAALAEDAAVADDGDGDASRFRGVSLAINLGSPGEVDEVFAAWVAAGATAVKPPESVFWGGYSSYVADPDGHLWELAHNPYFPMDDTGRVRAPD